MTNLQSIEDRAEDLRKRAADRLESAADTVRTAGHQSADAISGLADDAGKKLDSTAAFVRTPKEKMLTVFRSSVRRNPMTSLAVATAIGLVAGFSCRASR